MRLHPDHEQKIAALRTPGLLRLIASARNAELRWPKGPKASAAAALRDRYEQALLLCAGPLPTDPALIEALHRAGEQTARAAGATQQVLVLEDALRRQEQELRLLLGQERAARREAEDLRDQLAQQLAALQAAAQPAGERGWSGTEDIDGGAGGQDPRDPQVDPVGPGPSPVDAGDERGGPAEEVDGVGRGAGLAGEHQVEHQVEEQLATDGDHQVVDQVEAHPGHQVEEQVTTDEEAEDAPAEQPQAPEADTKGPCCATPDCRNKPPGKSKLCNTCRGRAARARRIQGASPIVHAGAAAAPLRRTRKDR